MAFGRKKRDDPHPHPVAFAAAASRLTLSNPKKAQTLAGKRQDWQQDAWVYHDNMPEVHFVTTWAGHALSQIRLVAAVEATGDEEPTPVNEPDVGISIGTAAAAMDEIARLGPTAQLLETMSANLDVPGECWLIGWGAREEQLDMFGAVVQEATVETWEAHSVDEVVTDQRGTRVRSGPSDQGRPLVDGIDCAVRIWQRHPRWSDLADSPMRSLVGVCEALLTFQNEQMAQSRARHNNGLLLLPRGFSNGPVPGQPMLAAGQEDPLLTALREGFEAPVLDPSNGGGAPGMLMGAREDIAAAKWLDLGRKPSAETDDKIEKAVARLARGLNAPVEVVMGHQNTTYANAEQVDEDEFEDFHRPRIKTICEGLTIGFLRPNLLARGLPPDEVARVIVWFDASDLLAEPDMGPAADIAHDKLVISDEAYRRYRRFRDDDKPSDEEVLRRTGVKRGILAGDLTLALLKLIDPSLEVSDPSRVEPVPVEPIAPAEDTPAEDEPADPPPEDSEEAGAAAMLVLALVAGKPEPMRSRTAAALARLPISALLTMAHSRRRGVTAAAPPRARSNAGRQLADIDRDLRARLLTLADAQLAQALERAGNRLRGKAGTLRELTTGIEPHLRAAHVGRNLIAAAGISDDDMLDGAFATMESQFMEWGATAQAEAVEVVNRVVAGFSTAERAALMLRQAEDLAEAWTWLRGTLQSLAKARLFDPLADAMDEIGEVASSAVPPGIIREAIARAGGSAALSTTPSGGAYVTMTDAGTRPAGGIGTGDLLATTMRDHGVAVEGYEWVYGPGGRRSPFEPHAALDGVQFVSFDDDVLANGGAFPATSHYLPGDHRGCLCDVAPILIPAEELADTA